MQQIMSYSHRLAFGMLIAALTNVVGCSDEAAEKNLVGPSDSPTPADSTDAAEPSFLVAKDPLTNQMFHRLEAPAVVSWTRVSRHGDRSTAKVRVTNLDERTIDSVAFKLVRIDEDGQFQDSPTGGAIPHGAGGIHLVEGESKTFDISEMFLNGQVGAVEALITEIEYTNGTNWPPMPTGLIGDEGDEPVAIRMIGYVSSPSFSQAVLACRNNSLKPLQGIEVTIKYLDADGQNLHFTSTGWGGDWQIAPGQGDVLCGGDGPPKNAVDATVKIRSIEFTDESTSAPLGN